PHGMSLDGVRRWLFVASEGSARLQAFDLRTMKIIADEPVGQDPDVLSFDPVWRRLYVAAESGVVSLFAERGGRLAREGRVTMPHAHTVWADPRTHLVYFPLQNIE